MSKRDEAKEILQNLGLPKQQQNERSCLTLLALAGLAETTPWSRTKRPLLRIWDIMGWMKEQYGKEYAANSRETIRRQTVHQFEQSRLVDKNPDDPTRPTNSGDTRYQLTKDAAEVLRAFERPDFTTKREAFLERHGSLTKAYERARRLHKVPVTLPDGSKVELSPGIHNELQRLIIEEFAPRFAAGSVVVYLGDTANKRLCVATEILAGLSIPEMNHDKLPDVVLYDSDRDWLFLIEAVTTHGPVSPKRHAELEAALSGSNSGRVFVTAFMDMKGFSKYSSQIAFESEVWIASLPDHMIHYNGARFLGPYPPREKAL